MIGWKEYKLGEIGRVVTGKTPPTKDEDNYGGLYPFICIPDLGDSVRVKQTTKTVSEKGLQTVRNCLLPKDSVVVSCIATIGKIGMTDRPSVTNQQINSIIPDEKIVDSKFLYYRLSNFKEILESFGGGGSVFNIISKSKFENIPISIPNLSEQKAIAKILSSLDNKIELNRRMNATLEAMARALFKAWFVDFEPVHANTENRPSTSASPEIAKLFPSDFENGIPKGWFDTTIGRIVSIQNGYAFKSSDFKEDGKHGVIKIRNISGNQVDVLSTQFIDKTVADIVNERFKISSSDALIAMTGAEVGKVGLVPKINSDLWLNQRVGLIREKIKGSKWFAYLVLSSDETRNQLLDVASGSAQPNISGAQIEKTNSITPTDKLIEQFGELVNPIFAGICEHRFENQLLAEIRDVLLPRLIAGKIKVMI